MSGNYWSMNHFLDEINWLVLWEIFTYQQKFPSISAAAYCLFKKVRWISQHYLISIWLLWETKIKWCVTNSDIINTALTFVITVSSQCFNMIFLGEPSTSFYYLITFIVFDIIKSIWWPQHYHTLPSLELLRPQDHTENENWLKIAPAARWSQLNLIARIFTPKTQCEI